MPACRQASVRLLRVAVLVLLPLGSTLPLPATAAPAVSVETAAQEIVGLATRTGPRLQTRVLRPPGREPFPLAIVSHGSPPDGSQRPTMEIPTFSSVSNWLLQRGYMVALPLRRGYGQTGGPWLENFGSCSSPDYYRAGMTTAQDIRTAIDYFRGRPEVQRDRILLVGLSAGGWGSLAAASQNPAGVFAVINFAGGRGGGHPKVGNCAPQRLVDTAARYGSTARVPTRSGSTRSTIRFSRPIWRARCPVLSFVRAVGRNMLHCRPSAATGIGCSGPPTGARCGSRRLERSWKRSSIRMELPSPVWPALHQQEKRA
jgi:dienelactone hydrolase